MIGGRKGQLVSYLAIWALIGTALVIVPTVLSPLAEKNLTTTTLIAVNPDAPGSNVTTTSYPYKFTSSNSTLGVDLTNNVTFTVQSATPTNITITAYSGNTHALTITSSAPANV